MNQHVKEIVKNLKRRCFILFVFALYIFSPIPARAATETYDNSVQNAKDNAVTPSGAIDWRAAASSIVTIPDSGGTHGLQYTSSGKLIVRAATFSSYFKNDYVGEQNYTIHGNPTTDATWVTTGNDLTNFYDKNGAGATNTNLIKFTERSLGIDNKDASPHDAIVEFAVTANNDTMMRPTRNSDINTYNPSQYGDGLDFIRPPGMSDTAWSNFQTYYNSWRNQSKPGGSNPFPWTQLGYTYFWGNGVTPPTSLAQIQGLSEFILLGGTAAEIVGIYSTSSYIYTKNNGQYGNGYPNFNITGPCNSVWAGHVFQSGVSRSASSPNEITVGSGGLVTGGQGILVWSLNYVVNNSGTISTDGATNKFNVTDTAAIGVMFEGDASTLYGTPITSGINKVINSGLIEGTDAGGGTGIYITSGDTTILNTGTISGATAIQVSGGTTSVTNSGTINGDIKLTDNTSAALNVGTGNVVLSNSGVYRQGPGTTLRFTAASASDYGKVTAAAGAVLNSASKVIFDTAGYIPNNSVFTAVNTSGTSIGSLPGTITASSPIFAVSGSVATKNLVVTATRANPYNTFASNSSASFLGSFLETTAAAGATGDVLTIVNNLDSITSADHITQALNSLLPNVDNSSPQVTQASQDQYLSTVFAHLDAYRNVTSDALTGPDVWASGFGSYLHQDPRGSSNGYNATVWGTALGYDVLAFDNLRLGLSGGFAQDFVRGKDSSARTDLDNYQGTLYGSYAKDAYYIDTAFSFAYNTYDASRHVTVGAFDRIARGDYNGQQYSAYIGGGYKFTGKNVELTPLASFQYSHLRLGSYSEDGAGAANLTVAAQDYDVAQTGLGMKFGYPQDLKNNLGKLTPELKFKWLYDWIGEAQQATSTFTGGGGSFNTTGFTPAQSSYDFGAKLTLETPSFVTLSLSYDLEVKENFYGHYGLLEARYRF